MGKPINKIQKMFRLYIIQVYEIVFLETSFRIVFCYYRPYASKLQVIVGDVLKTDLPYFDVCVA